MNIDSFNYKEFLPFYLTEDQKIGLANALKDFSDTSLVFTNKYPNDTLQGDLWEKTPYMDFVSGRKDEIHVFVLSNSCDVDPSNSRDFPVFITYAPVINFSAYENALVAKGFDAQVVAAKMFAIRGQKITNMMFLPAEGKVDVESIVLLDRAISVPYKAFADAPNSQKLTSLNQFGHYLLSFKLSIHFCRMHEGLARG
ncbi:hypothetical protein RYA05_09990 [Pseudomonas syringae pv. actinidiae]|uniref:Uncharacterized protein n=1 Tax=Pseudomonas syringae pv. actinidiae TaxID=103796 RepID=M1JA80_PSESF|nr:hypothetical protein [Pseudomonas syringae]AGE82553.1 hypothetical protein [Pseudomonas syringae pv. actinidiae]MBL3624199.1 hypothetical protein [Pseudomonas syringae pv. actinidiae]MBL3661138.1 hypothetical protein [Pseudomonas syringae pv. actinidiae]MDU8211354.1 hypothetical protein [Pseudomonas syringae pv. actinidiae]MDU8243215.1 hypothetical protein [Pseudomonas syringae pv. actinidiae]